MPPVWKRITLKKVAAWMFAFYCAKRYLAEPITLNGASMQPTIQDKDCVLSERYTTLFKKNDYKRGDILIVRHPNDPNKFLCKRLAGLPGDSVQGDIFSSRIVPRGHVWLLGDNASNSVDSRELGPVPIGLIQGRVVLRFLPLSGFTIFNRKTDEPSDLTITTATSNAAASKWTAKSASK